VAERQQERGALPLEVVRPRKLRGVRHEALSLGDPGEIEQARSCTLPHARRTLAMVTRRSKYLSNDASAAAPLSSTSSQRKPSTRRAVHPRIPGTSGCL